VNRQKTSPYFSLDPKDKKDEGIYYFLRLIKKKEFDFILCSGYQKRLPQKLCKGYIFL
jgi:hypothetical protein